MTGGEPPVASELMIDINHFAKRAEANAQQAVSVPDDSKLQVTFRGIVYPWHLDHKNHMNVQHYTAMFDQSSWVLLAMLGLDGQYFQKHGRGMAALEQTIHYRSELRSGDMFEIRSAIVEVRDKTIRLLHNMHKVRCGTLAASTTILGVHIDSHARKSTPLPASIRDCAESFQLSTEDNSEAMEPRLVCA
jgi:acyl-CoA thioester hydrolase